MVCYRKHCCRWLNISITFFIWFNLHHLLSLSIFIFILHCLNSITMSWFQNCLILEIELQLAHKFFQNLKRQVWEIRFFVCGDPPTHICPYQWPPPSNPPPPSSSPSESSLPGPQTSLSTFETSSPIFQTSSLDHLTSCLACHFLPWARQNCSLAGGLSFLANLAFLAWPASHLARQSPPQVLDAKVSKTKPKLKSNPVGKTKADSPSK